ncbi:MAG: hypothetical protein SPK00_05205 [Corynebacterium glucuronolyticum]|nr:hypothetical protein [Corynebacterium glucuronolyticum]MDD7586280.1 hypothetical protein [Mycobacteriaceae bacterium]MDY5834130.1 hypothetical protein [Corynebacterium glucuronolyticum]
MTAIRNQRGGVRRGVSIAAAALSLALVAPAIQPVQGGVAPLASAQDATTQASGDYVPANVGRVFDEGKDVRYAGLTSVSVKDETDGTDFKLQVPHWLVTGRTIFLTGGSTEDSDASKAFLRFQDEALYSQIDRISVVGENNDKQGDFVKRDPNGSEWSLDLSTVKNFPGSAGKNYSSFYKIYLNNGVEASSLQDAGDGFAVTQYWIRRDGRIVKNSVSRALLSADGKLPPSMPEKVYDGSKDAALGSENILNRPVSKFVSYDQGKNEINSIIWLPMTQNFLQASFDWAWQLEEQIDPALIPFIDSVVVYNSDKDGNLNKDRTQFELGVDSERNVVTTTQNKQLTWGEDDADITGATDPRFKEVRANWDDILYGTLGQTRPITIKYKLKDGALEGIQNATGGYVDFASWINADVFDKRDGGAPVDVLSNSYGYTYLNLTDTDGDGLLDSYESELGTDSSKFDTDGDGVPDGQEVLKDKTDPKNPGSYKVSTPDPEATKIQTTDNEFIVNVPKEVFKDNDGKKVPVTNNDTKVKVALVPESAITTDPETGKVTVDFDQAVGTVDLDRPDTEKGVAKITNISGIEKEVTYKAVAQTPAGEIAVSEKTIVGTDEPVEQTKTPTIEPLTTDSKTVTVKAESGADVRVELPDGTVIIPKEDAENPGTFTASIPQQAEGAEIKATANVDGKRLSEEATTKVTAATPEESPLTVTGDPKPVNPTDEDQDTGLKVENKTDKTTAVATDEDGKKIPVTIGKDGTITVTPGKDVDGPITVTINDPSLDKPIVKEVPVTGHKKGVDDNNSGKATEVPADGKGKEIDGKVENPDGATGVVVDENGKEISGSDVKIDEEGNVTVTIPSGTEPGKGKVIITGKDGNKTELPIIITKPVDASSSIDGLTEDQANKCVGASAASAIPLLLLTPIALGLAMDNQQVKDLTAGFGKQLEDINTGIQKTLGIYNPQLAQQFKVQVAPHLQNLALAAGFIASIALLAGVAATQCVPGGGSSDNTTAQK